MAEGVGSGGTPALSSRLTFSTWRSFGIEQRDRFGGNNDAGARPEHPRQWSLRRQTLLQAEPICPEFEGDPAESLDGFQ